MDRASAAREHHFLPVAIVFDLPERLCQERNRDRPDRDFGPHVIRNQQRQLKRGLRSLKREGFRQIHVLDSPDGRVGHARADAALEQQEDGARTVRPDRKSVV